MSIILNKFDSPVILTNGINRILMQQGLLESHHAGYLVLFIVVYSGYFNNASPQNPSHTQTIHKWNDGSELYLFM